MLDSNCLASIISAMLSFALEHLQYEFILLFNSKEALLNNLLTIKNSDMD